MERKVLLRLLLCFAGSIATVASLVLMSDDLSSRPNSFLRRLPPHPVIQAASFDIGFNSYYIAGATDRTVYLGNATAPLHVVTFDLSLSDSQAFKVEMGEYRTMRFWSVRVRVDSPAFCMTDGTVPVILRGKVADWKIAEKLSGSAYFMDVTPINALSFAIRSLSATSNQYVLGKEVPGRKLVELREGILEKQVDGKFCVDGMMEFDKTTARLIYVYFYRNQFIVMDSSLNLEGRRRTIDTTSVAKVKVAAIRSENSVTLAAPPMMVNKHMSVYGNWLFINSALMARNELEEDFDKLSVIDVYDISTGEYKFSFYLSHFSGVKITDFKVVRNRLIAIFGRHIAVFNMSSRYFSELFQEDQ